MIDDIKKPEEGQLPEGDVQVEGGSGIGPVNSDKALSKSQALVVQFKELDKKTESWIQSWNPYHPDSLQTRKVQPIEIHESQLRKHATTLFLITFG